MAIEIKMPQLSDTMHSGKILAWRKNEGDAVKRGEILAEVETDKANLEIESFHEGVLLKIMSAAGATAQVGDVIAVLGKSGEALETPATAPSPTESPAPITQASASAPAAAPATQPAPPSHAAQPAQDESRTKISPLARKLAEDNRISLATLHGSGPDGRIVKKDVEQAMASPIQRRVLETSALPSGTQNVSRPVPTTVQPLEGTLQPLSKMRATIAARMQQSVNESPHFYCTVSVRMDEAVKLRESLKQKPDYKGISVNHLIIKATAYALAEQPGVNCAWRDGQIYNPQRINVGVITAVDDGLLIPVIHDADRLALKDLVFEVRAAIERARAGRPSSADLLGGTFSISNLGMYEVDNFTAIVSPGQGAVLSVGAALEKPVVHNGHIVPGLVMMATLALDHRVIDGLMAALFLRSFRQALETPALLLA